MAFLLAGAWIADRLWPFVPTLDIDHIKDALKPLLLHPVLVPVEVLRHGACWLAFAALLHAGLPGRLSRALAFSAMFAGPFASLALEGRVISASSVLGAGLAIVAWWPLSRHSATAIARWLAILLAATVVVVGLAPFAFSEAPRHFDWIPFRGYMDSSILGASRAFLAKAFLFGSAVWASWRAGLGLIASGATVSGLLLAVGWAQTYLPAQPAGITDALIALCMTLAIQSFSTPRRSAQATTPMSLREHTASETMPVGNADS
jgi:hypothetical protein